MLLERCECRSRSSDAALPSNVAAQRPLRNKMLGHLEHLKGRVSLSRLNESVTCYSWMHSYFLTQCVTFCVWNQHEEVYAKVADTLMQLRELTFRAQFH